MTLATYAVQVDGRSLPPVRAVVERGHALFPIRALAETLAAQVAYDPASGAVTVRRAGRTVALASPRIVAGRAYAPLRTVAEALGADVRYDAAARRIALHGVTVAAAPAFLRATQPTPVPGAAESAPASPPGPPVSVVSFDPPQGAAIDRTIPTLAAHLIVPGPAVDPQRVTLSLDGIPLAASLIGDTIAATPRSAIAAGTHTATVGGADVTGRPFSATWTFVETTRISQAYSAPVPVLGGAWLDRVPTAGERRFDVYADGAPGANGYVTIDGTPGGWPLVNYGFAGAGRAHYVAHVLLPPGVNQPNARVRIHLTPAYADAFEYMLPTTFSIDTAAPPAPAATPVAGAPRRVLAPPARRVQPPRPTAKASPSAKVPS